MPGTACAVEVRWRAGAPVAYEAALQWRSDGTNPAPLRLQAQGVAASAPTVPPAVAPTSPPSNPPQVEGGNSGGGCTGSGSGLRADSGTTLWMAGAVAALLVRRGRRHR